MIVKQKGGFTFLSRKGAAVQTKARLPIGIENFEDIRRNGYYYVDKTGFIRDLLQKKGGVRKHKPVYTPQEVR